MFSVLASINGDYGQQVPTLAEATVSIIMGLNCGHQSVKKSELCYGDTQEQC